ncbi:sensor histidine kinase [Fortiea contorta]|uniref:sensor histidine kinase n=1 Tax=Fortiea contorta TaxID=1892405 RepID=UPI00037CB22A|nr:sensor histidine kinase [Fortiea contorta]
MARSIKFQTHPFRLLLYLEWILLGITVLPMFPLGEIFQLRSLFGIPPAPHGLPSPFSSLTILSIFGFGLMGLKLPKRQIDKLLYTALELGLILIATDIGGRNNNFSLLYLIVVIRSCLIFSPQGRLIVAGLVFISFLLTSFIPIFNISSLQAPIIKPMPGQSMPWAIAPPPPPRPPAPLRYQITADEVKFLMLNLTLNTALLFGLVLVFVLLLVNALLAERQSRQKLAQAHNQLQQYALRIEDQATLQERNRIAREIHDSLGHYLTAQSIQLENAMLFCQTNVEKTEIFLTAAKKLGSNALKEVRQSVASLRVDPLQGQSLENAIANLLLNFQNMTNIQPNCCVNISQSLTSDVSTASYRIIQEALTNIYKHSQATQVTLELQTEAGMLSLLVEDNGQGFNPEQNTTGFGLQGMLERTLALGGKLQIISQPADGCRIQAIMPILNR